MAAEQERVKALLKEAVKMGSVLVTYMGLQHLTANELDLREVHAEVRDESGCASWRYGHRHDGEFFAVAGDNRDDGKWDCSLVFDKHARVAHVRVALKGDARPRTTGAAGQGVDDPGPEKVCEDGNDGVGHGKDYTKRKEVARW